MNKYEDAVYVGAEIYKNFIPHSKVQSKHRVYFRWDRGPEYVEVQVRGFKIGKLGTHEKRSWITSHFAYPTRLKNGRTAYRHITCSYEYDKVRLTSLLDELNRVH